MTNYGPKLKEHLAAYARARLGVHEAGTFDGRAYQHILPERLRFLNFLETIRAEAQVYLGANPGLRLHQYFHHLNSSQALAFNLFLPFLNSGEQSTDLLCDALGVPRGIAEWWFERVHDEADQTNVDIAWRNADGAHVFCEVKLSESEFGVALPDARHLDKRKDVYLPKLQDLVSEEFLEERSFFQHYQILRNVSLLCGHSGHRVVFIVPAENRSLRPALKRVLQHLSDACKPRVSVVYLEDLIERLLANTVADAGLLVHTRLLKEKYVLR